MNPTSSQLQTAFRDSILTPPNQTRLTDTPTYNPFNGNPDFDRLIVCYSKQRTLGNILAPRKHRFGDDFNTQEYLRKLQGINSL
jgi:hypothetical protein